MKIKDRIKAFRRVPANELLPSPKNWRTHGEQQQNALRGVLAEIGLASAVLVRETPDGLMLVDGHLRTELMQDAEVPVLVLDITEAEADLLLATFDPISAMAEADKNALASLLDDLSSNSDAVNAMLDGLKVSAGLYLDAGKEFDETCADDVKLTTCPHCGESFPA